MKTRLYVAGVLGGLAALVAVALAVFAFGRTNPSPPSLLKSPNSVIPGELLYTRRDSCFIQAQASGESRTVRACVPTLPGAPALYWIDADTAEVVRYDQRGAVLWDVDLNTGAERDTGRVVSFDFSKTGPGGLSGGSYAPDGSYATTDSEGGLFVVNDGVRTQIASFDVPEYNPPQVILWSPDSKWILLQYYPRRADSWELWIVSRDGKTKGTIATSVLAAGAAWRMDGLVTQPPLP